jgi:hypothetical protein
MSDHKQQYKKARYKLPLTFHRPIRRRFDPETGTLKSYFIEVDFVSDGRVDIEPGEWVLVTVERAQGCKS